MAIDNDVRVMYDALGDAYKPTFFQRVRMWFRFRSKAWRLKVIEKYLQDLSVKAIATMERVDKIESKLRSQEIIRIQQQAVQTILNDAKAHKTKKSKRRKNGRK